jgi:hypothetical protein
MSRLRKNVKTNTKQPYKGDFSQTFMGGLSTQTPFAKVNLAAMRSAARTTSGTGSGGSNTAAARAASRLAERAAARGKSSIGGVRGLFGKVKERAKAVVAGAAADAEAKMNELKEKGAAAAAKNNVGGKDQIPSDTDYSREEVGAFFQRVKLAKEQEKLDADKAAAEDAAAEEKEDEVKNRPGGLTNDYDCDMTKADRKAEKRENKGEIKDEKKACFKRGPGGSKKTCGLGRKNKACRQHRKKCRQTKRGAMKENRQLNRAIKKECPK